MSKMEMDEIEDKPLDPELEKVRRKMIRLLGVSIGIMFVGLMAVLAAVVYKVTQQDEETPVAASETAVPVETAPVAAAGPVEAALPPGFVVEDVSLDGGNILFFGRLENFEARAFIVDVASGRIVGELTIER